MRVDGLDTTASPENGFTARSGLSAAISSSWPDRYLGHGYDGGRWPCLSLVLDVLRDHSLLPPEIGDETAAILLWRRFVTPLEPEAARRDFDILIMRSPDWHCGLSACGKVLHCVAPWGAMLHEERALEPAGFRPIRWYRPCG